MAQNRTERLVILLEPVVYNALKKAMEKEEKNTSESSYGRKLIVKDLLNSGLLTEKMLVDANT